jgi:hypothetical protein
MAGYSNPAYSTAQDNAEYLGRDITWVCSTGGDFTTDTDAQLALEAIAQHGTIEVVGEVTAAGFVVGLSGAHAHIAAGSGTVWTALEARLDAIQAQTLSIKTVTGVGLA